jgi:cytochrome c oxidase cbb3-type subunit III
MKKNIVQYLSLFLVLLYSFSLSAQTVEEIMKPKPKLYESEMVYIFLFVICLLAIIIIVMMRVLFIAAKYSVQRTKEASAKSILPVAVVILSLLFSTTLLAQTNAPHQPAYFSEAAVQVLFWILGLEIIAILYLSYQIHSILSLQTEELTISASVTKKSFFTKWLSRITKHNSEEALALDLGHNYDGIRELDNNVPAWWKYGFAFSIVFAVAYLYSYHVGYSKPLQQEELRIDMQAAADRHALYLENAANNIDENSVTLLGTEDIAAGWVLFIKPGACATCHGENGSGIVNGITGIGPNLTDNYWLHKGDIRSIFYSIKYGWPEKGMKSWKDDYSPKQIAQLSSFIKSLQGTNPKPAKEKQGILFVDDTTKVSIKP